MQPLYIMEAADVRRADEPESSRALTIGKVGLPAIKFFNTEHKPGGGAGAINFVFPQIEALEPKFELKGIPDVDIVENIGLTDGTKNKWIFAGAVRDKKTGILLPSRAIIEGIVAEWEPDEFEIGELVGCNHVLHEVTHYEFHLGDKELWYYDWWEREFRRGKKNPLAAVKAALGGS